MELKNKFKINDFVMVSFKNQIKEELPDWLKGANQSQVEIYNNQENNFNQYSEGEEVVIWRIINIIFKKDKKEFYYFVDIKGWKEIKESELKLITDLEHIVNFNRLPMEKKELEKVYI